MKAHRLSPDTYIKSLLLLLMGSLLSACDTQPKAEIQGEQKKWHRITLLFEGPASSEMAEDNPFLDYRLDVTFTNGNKKYVVPASMPPMVMPPKRALIRGINGRRDLLRTKRENGLIPYPSKKGRTLRLVMELEQVLVRTLWMGWKAALRLVRPTRPV